MNYYEPLQIEKDGKPSGKYRMTVTQDKHSMAIGYCRELNCEHATPEEASDCYRKYINEKCDGMLPGGFPLMSKQGTVFKAMSHY